METVEKLVVVNLDGTYVKSQKLSTHQLSEAKTFDSVRHAAKYLDMSVYAINTIKVKITYEIIINAD